MVHSLPRRLRDSLANDEDEEDEHRLSGIFHRLSVQQPQQPQRQQQRSIAISSYKYNDRVVELLNQMIDMCRPFDVQCYLANVRPIFANQESRRTILEQLDLLTFKKLIRMACAAIDKPTLIDLIILCGTSRYMITFLVTQILLENNIDLLNFVLNAGVGISARQLETIYTNNYDMGIIPSPNVSKWIHTLKDMIDEEASKAQEKEFEDIYLFMKDRLRNLPLRPKDSDEIRLTLISVGKRLAKYQLMYLARMVDKMAHYASVESGKYLNSVSEEIDVMGCRDIMILLEDIIRQE